MEEEHRGIALVILGIIAIIAVIGLVLMFTGANKSAGAVFTNVPYGPGAVTAGPACDSPCTMWPSGNEYDTQMQNARVNALNRGWTMIGTVKIDGTTQTGYGSEATTGAWKDPVLQCWCPPKGNPAFRPTQEYAAIVPGTGSGNAVNVGRMAGTPVRQYSTVQYASGAQGTGPVPSYPYPASLTYAQR